MAKIELVSYWKHAWKLTTVWAFIIVGVFPDIYNGVIAAGLHDQLPETAKLWLRGMAIIGIAFRLVRQKAVEKHVVKDDEQDANH
ncbi:holin [Erwinia phage vB_EamP-S6]|uniref:Gp092 n=1 Tax=Erwinia phage vB_EamP-S6 TaxID=1051675 RepID=G0YQI4_9CAUD|nr:holin [Erwinia phage vB_EamP-S6]AEJ81611.1 gp092 [Erwinia phage vB_EamP-S6]